MAKDIAFVAMKNLQQLIRENEELKAANRKLRARIHNYYVDQAPVIEKMLNELNTKEFD